MLDNIDKEDKVLYREPHNPCPFRFISVVTAAISGSKDFALSCPLLISKVHTVQCKNDKNALTKVTCKSTSIGLHIVQYIHYSTVQKHALRRHARQQFRIEETLH